MLEEAGVAGIDVAGVGGTSWAAVEYYRAKRRQDEFHQRLGETFWDWGIPTALSVLMVLDSTELDVIATGGIRSGLDVAKAPISRPLARFFVPLTMPPARSCINTYKDLYIFLHFLV